MPDSSLEVSIRTIDDIAKIPRAEWDACAGTGNPFLTHDFLAIVEQSGSATAETGWLPQHVVVERGDGQILGLVPLYVKGHSYGEYVFDHGWANAYERAGGNYYPKLQSAVPFTPVTGPRLLLRPGVAESEGRPLLIKALEAVTNQLKLSSLHVTFCTQSEANAFAEAGWLRRSGQQYHWQNCGYASFEAFLDALSSRKRKAIRRERRAVAEAGVTFEVLTGDELKPAHWDRFYQFYRNTTERKWGEAYLTRRFFALLNERMADRVALVMARLGGEPVAGALNLIGENTLYGRNWGCTAAIPFLHFETCYYRAIDFAIAHGLDNVEAGAQGQHKVQRGYVPVKTYSSHFIRDANFRAAVADFLHREGEMVDWEIAALTAAAPFRKTDPLSASSGDENRQSPKK